MKHNLIEIAGLAITFASIIWKISQLRADIYKYIDNIKADIYEYVDTRTNIKISETNSLAKDLAVHVAACKEKDDNIDYKINALKESIEHKSNRLSTDIKKIESTLQSKGLI